MAIRATTKPAWAWMIPWRSNQGRRCGGSGPSAKSGSDSVGGATCDKAEGQASLEHRACVPTPSRRTPGRARARSPFSGLSRVLYSPYRIVALATASGENPAALTRPQA